MKRGPNVKEIDPLSAFLSFSVIKMVNCILLLPRGKRRDAAVKRAKLRLPGKESFLS